MGRALWIRIKRDWTRQPLAILPQITSIFAAIGIAAFGALASPVTIGPPDPLAGVAAEGSTKLAISLLLASLLATISGAVFKRTIVGGFFCSLLLASFCILIFSLSGKATLTKTSVLSDSAYKGPLIDLTYWAVFSIFVAICAGPAMRRITATWGQITSKSENGTVTKLGVAPIEFVIFAVIWGWSLSGAQQRIVGAFVFEQPPSIVEPPQGSPKR
jgi:hypothetical protein